MDWNKLSLDEIEHNQELIKEFRQKPVETAIELIKVCLKWCYTQLGVQNADSEIAREAEKEMLGIDTVDVGEEAGKGIARAAHQNYNESILGYYVYQWDEPRYFIPRPEPPKNGEAVFRIIDLRKEVEVKAYHLRFKWTT
jgi:hypothetical protein